MSDCKRKCIKNETDGFLVPVEDLYGISIGEALFGDYDELVDEDGFLVDDLFEVIKKKFIRCESNVLLTDLDEGHPNRPLNFYFYVRVQFQDMPALIEILNKYNKFWDNGAYRASLNRQYVTFDIMPIIGLTEAIDLYESILEYNELS